MQWFGAFKQREELAQNLVWIWSKLNWAKAITKIRKYIRFIKPVIQIIIK